MTENPSAICLEKYKIGNIMTDCIIIGGGPAGLTAAYHAIKHGLTPIVFEQENFLGGISRTVNYKDYLFDIGGHRFFSKVQVINDIWDEILGDDMLRRGRLSRIYYNGKFFHYPLKPFNALFGLGLFPSVRVLTSYMYSQLFPDKKEDNFETWVSNRFGKYLFSIFFKSYTEKVWGIPCHEISSEWAAQRIKQLSLTKAVLNAFFEKPTSSSQVITTLIHEFKYPKCGPGMMWEKMAEKIKNSGGEVHLNSRVKEIHVQHNRIQHITVMQDGKEIPHQAQHFISSMPIRNLFEQMSPSPAKEIMDAATGLNYRDFILIAVIVNQKDIFPDNWIYIHDPQVKLGRIQNFKNWSPHMVPDQEQTCLGLEYFCFEGDGLWNKQDEELIAQAKRELETIHK